MATLPESGLRIKTRFSLPFGVREKLFYAAVIALVASLSFVLGRLSAAYGQDDGFGMQYTESQ